ncbi:hypothetical protein C8R42DRAFT_725899 [Lentinula raphanica]|nr:hypothetical protein C8R42DRAFT_725899 [Lentinula raphanica]
MFKAVGLSGLGLGLFLYFRPFIRCERGYYCFSIASIIHPIWFSAPPPPPPESSAQAKSLFNNSDDEGLDDLDIHEFSDYELRGPVQAFDFGSDAEDDEPELEDDEPELEDDEPELEVKTA